MKDYRQIIADEIRATTRQWLDLGTVSTIRQIGDGQCEDFAGEVLQRLHARHPETAELIFAGYTDDWWLREIDEDGRDMGSAVSFEADIPRLRSEGAPLPPDLSDEELSSLIGTATHMWIRWDGLHFDATAPDGRTHFLEMPFFADQVAGYRDDPERKAA